MRVLVVDGNELYRCEERAMGVVVLYNWGCAVIDEHGMHEYCQDLEKLLSNPDVNESHLKAVKAWLKRCTDKSSGARSG